VTVHPFLRFLLPLAAIVGSLAGTLALLNSVGPKPEKSAGAGGSVEQVAGDSPKSLYRAKNFAKVIATLRREAGPEGVITNLRLDASKANATLRKGTQGEDVTIVRGGKVNFKTSIPSSTGSGFSPRALSSKAPERIAAAIKEQSGFGLDRIDYMVALDLTTEEKLQWDAFTTDPQHTNYLADADGRNVKHPGGGSVDNPGFGSSGSSGSSSGSSPPSSGGTRTFTGKDAQKINECISRAGGDPQKIQACVP
jgi:hypothetical protein